MSNEKSELRIQNSEYRTAVLEYDETVDLVKFGFAPSRRWAPLQAAGALTTRPISSATLARPA